MTIFNTITKSYSVVERVLPPVTIFAVHNRATTELVVRRLTPQLAKFVGLDNEVFLVADATEARKKAFNLLNVMTGELGNVVMLDPQIEYMPSMRGVECRVRFTPVVLADVDVNSFGSSAPNHYNQQENPAIGFDNIMDSSSTSTTPVSEAVSSLLTTDKYTIPVTQLKNTRA